MAAGYLQPLTDIDIWWHLATGRYLLQAKAFLASDPFGPSDVPISPGRELILNGYWLSQVLFYKVWQYAGLTGLVVLRIGLLLTPPLAVLVYGWRRFRFSPAVLLLALLCGWAMIDVSGIRPNHLTVAFVPLVLILLSKVGFFVPTDSGEGYQYRTAWLLPPFMLLWANLHGGFLLGIAIVILYAATESVVWYRFQGTIRPTGRLWGIVGLTVIASLITPNGLDTYIQYLAFQGGVIQQKTSEYISPITLATSGTLFYWPYFLLLLTTAAIVCMRRSAVAASRIVLLLAMAILSLTAFRYAPLFAGGAAILLLPELESLRAHRWGRRCAAGATAMLLCGLVVTAGTSYQQNTASLRHGMIDSSRFPVTAVDYLQQHTLNGTVFNHFNWGGYLAWRSPQSLIPFVDGRSLKLPLFHAYTRILWLPEEARGLLDRYRIAVIVMPRLNPFTGEFYALNDVLAQSPDWALVYHDATASIFLRSSYLSAHQEIPALDKALIYTDVLGDITRWRKSRGDNSHLDNAERQATYRLRQMQPATGI